MRILLRIVLGIVVLLAIGLGVLLVPPHLQTRGIAPALPDAEALRSLATAPDGPIAIRWLKIASQDLEDGDRNEIGHTVFLAEWADGRTFMIDAGMDEAGAADFAELLRTLGGAGEDRFHGDVAAQLGSDVSRVRGVGFTHLHIDHVQGIGAFCAARGNGAALLQTRSQAEDHNFNTTESAGLLAESCLEPSVLDGEGLLQPEGFPGLALVPLGGHTPGSTLFAFAVGGDLYLFSGDTTNSKHAIEKNEGKGALYSYFIVPENTARTEALRVWLKALGEEPDMTVVVSHDLDDVAASGLAEFSASPYPSRASTARSTSAAPAHASGGSTR